MLDLIDPIISDQLVVWAPRVVQMQEQLPHSAPPEVVLLNSFLIFLIDPLHVAIEIVDLGLKF